jgi:integrase
MRGHIKQRAKGTWTIVLDLSRDPVTGKRKQQWTTVKGTKKLAEQKLAELQHQMDTGFFVKPSKLTVGDYLQRWLTDYVYPHVRAATAEGYRIIVECHLIPNLGAVLLSELKPSHLQRYYAKALKEGRRDGRGGLAAITVGHHHTVLKEALSHAIKWELIHRNVGDAVTPPRPVETEMNALDPGGLEQILKIARGTMYFPLIHLATYTGMRRSELCGLRWKDVNLQRGTVSIAQILHCLKGGRIVIEAPKSAKGKRLIDLSQDAVFALRSYREVVEADQEILGTPLAGERLVFSKADGSPLLPNTVTHAFGKIARKAGTKGITLHSLRHSHASVMLQEGVSSRTVADRLGHSNVVITLGTYSHLTPGVKEEAATKFEEALHRAKSPVAETLR